MPDEVIVQPTAVSTETTLGVAVTPEVKTPEIQPLTEAKIAELVSKSLQSEMSKFTEQAKREIQSTKDKSKNEVENALRRANIAETTLRSIRGKVQDPDLVKDIELETLRAQDYSRQIADTEDAARRAQEEFKSQFQGNLKTTLESMGVDTNDKRIDWAEDSPNYLDAQKRVLSSAAVIVKENQSKVSDAKLTEIISAKTKEIEASVRKSLGLNSVDTTTPGGVINASDDAFVKKVAAGEPLTKEDYKRAKSMGLG